MVKWLNLSRKQQCLIYKKLKQSTKVSEAKINKIKGRKRSTLMAGDFNIPLSISDITTRPNNQYKKEYNCIAFYCNLFSIFLPYNFISIYIWETKRV